MQNYRWGGRYFRLFLPAASMNRLALPPTDMFIGHHVPIGTSMGRGRLCRNNALAPLIPFLRTVWLTLTPARSMTVQPAIGYLGS
jgi:hypothetical protein